MPMLRGLSCAVRYAPNGISFPEYGTLYGDGIVETYIAVPKEPCGFMIELKSHDYVSEGLAMVVFVDGTLNCNRIRTNLHPPNKKLPQNHSHISFLVRQKEKPLHSGTYMGRAWRFDHFNTVSDFPEGANKDQFDLLGTIEVLVLRCRADASAETSTYDSSSGEDSHIMSEGSDYEESGETAAQNDKEKSKQVEFVPEEAELPFAGLFDGPADEPPHYDYPNHAGYVGPGRDMRNYLDSSGRYENKRYRAPFYHLPRSPARRPYGSVSGRRGSPDPPDYPYRSAGRRVHFDEDRRDRAPAQSWKGENNTDPMSHQHFDRYYMAEEPYLGRRPPRDSPSPKGTERTPYRDYDHYFGQSHTPFSDERYRDYPPRPAHPPNYGCAPNASFPQPPPVPGAYQYFPPPPVNQPYFPYAALAPHMPYAPMPIAPPMTMPFNAIPPSQFPAAGFAPFYGADRNASASSKGSAPGPMLSSSMRISPGQHGGGQTQQPTNNASPYGGAYSAQENTGSANPDGFNNPGTDGQNWNNPASGNFVDSGQVSGGNQNGNADATWATGGDQSTDWKQDDSQNNNDNAGNWDTNNETSGNNHNDSWDQDNSGNNGNGQSGGWDTTNNQNNPETNGGWTTDNDQNNQSASNGWDTTKSNIGGGDRNDGGLARGLRPLYGPYGAYLDIARTSNERDPDAEEEPRYDVPQTVVSNMGISKQVQPGKGYLYLKKRSKPDYIDTLDKPYAKFVFNYRTTEQIEQELDIKLEVDPSNDKEVQELQRMDKQELINMVLRAKAGSGGHIPDTPPRGSAKVQSPPTLQPVPLDTSKFAFLDYDPLPRRYASQRTKAASQIGPSQNAKSQNKEWNDTSNNQAASDWQNNTSGNSNNNANNSNAGWGDSGEVKAPGGGESAYPGLTSPRINSGQAGDHFGGPLSTMPVPISSSANLFPSTYAGAGPRPSTPPPLHPAAYMPGGWPQAPVTPGQPGITNQQAEDDGPDWDAMYAD